MGGIAVLQVGRGDAESSGAGLRPAWKTPDRLASTRHRATAPLLLGS